MERSAPNGDRCQQRGSVSVPVPVGAMHDQGSSRGAVKPQSGRANGGEAAAKAVRTATKLSHRVTERYGAGF